MVKMVSLFFFIIFTIPMRITAVNVTFCDGKSTILECSGSDVINIAYSGVCHHQGNDCTRTRTNCDESCTMPDTSTLCSGKPTCDVNNITVSCTTRSLHTLLVEFYCIQDILTTTERYSVSVSQRGSSIESSLTTFQQATSMASSSVSQHLSSIESSLTTFLPATSMGSVSASQHGSSIETSRTTLSPPGTLGANTMTTANKEMHPTATTQSPCYSSHHATGDNEELLSILYSEYSDNSRHGSECTQVVAEEYIVEVNKSTTIDISGGDYTTRIYLPQSAIPDVNDVVVYISSEVISESSDRIRTPSNFTELQYSEATRVAIIVSIQLVSNNTKIQISEKSYIEIDFEIFEVLDTDQYDAYCVFWDNNPSPNTWSTHGCFVSFSNSSSTICRCNHLTSFTVLFALKSTADLAADKSTSILSVVVLSLSLFCLVAAGCIFVYVGLRKTFVIKVHFCLCVALASAHFLFLVGIDKTENEGICNTMAVAIHYCYTSALMWMLVESIHLYMTSRNYHLTQKCFYAFSAVGWASPFVIVVCSYGIFNRRYRSTEVCWLSADSGSIFVFLSTVVLVILVNVVAVSLVIRTFMNLKSNKNKNEIGRYRASIRAILLLQPIVGFTWVFGFVAGTSENLFFSYLFIIFNGLQGLFIFLFHCLDNNEVKKMLKLIRNKHLVKVDIKMSKRSSQATETSTINTASDQTR